MHLNRAHSNPRFACSTQVHDNSAAVELYRRGLGFEVEAEESEGAARALQRPRRLLLGKPLD